MDDQNNTNNQNPINPLDQNQIPENPQPIEEVVNINTQTIPDIPQQEEKPIQNENQSMENQGFAQMDSSTPPPPPIPTVEEIPDDKQGTNSPDINISSVVSTKDKKGKGMAKKTLATILGILILLGGIGAGIILLNQQQDIRQKATEPEYEWGLLPNGQMGYLYPGGCTTKGGNFVTKDGVTMNCSDAVAGRSSNGQITSCAPGYYLCTVDPSGLYSSACCKVGSGGSSSTNTPTSTTPTTKPTSTPNISPTPSTTPTTSVQCLNIKAYDTNWNILSTDDLEDLKSGDVVRFTVAGTATSGTFSKAKFTTNNVTQPETTSKKTGTEEFYIEYTIPINTTEFSIDAQIYHSTKGWI